MVRLYDIKRELDDVLALTRGCEHVLVPDHIRDATRNIKAYLVSLPPAPAQSTTIPAAVVDDAAIPNPRLSNGSVAYNVKITRTTWLEVLYRYDVGTHVEYPATSATGTVGHLFELDPNKEWVNPSLGFAYAQGIPSGTTPKHEPRYVEVLVDAEGRKVPCQVSYSTCMAYIPTDPNTLISHFYMLNRPGSENV